MGAPETTWADQASSRSPGSVNVVSRQPSLARGAMARVVKTRVNLSIKFSRRPALELKGAVPLRGPESGKSARIVVICVLGSPVTLCIFFLHTRANAPAMSRRGWL